MTTATDYALTCKGLHKYLGTGETRVHVLRGVDVELSHSTVYSVVGPSGCGKSTLLYLLGLLDREDGGQITLGGEEMSGANDDTRTAARNRHIGFVFQFHFLLQEFTALENIMIPMQKLGKRTDSEMQDRAQVLLESVGLGQKSHRLGNQLSGGEQQRVAVARSLANDPALLLADEPTGNLDLKNSQMVFELLKELAHKNGQAVLMVTHNNGLADMCDHTFRMRDGEFVS